MTGTPEGSTESGFMEKPGIEPATPGLQGIALIHYTTGASLFANLGFLRNTQFIFMTYVQSKLAGCTRYLIVFFIINKRLKLFL